MRRFVAVALVALIALSGCAEPKPPATSPPPGAGGDDGGNGDGNGGTTNTGTIDKMPAGDYAATIVTSKGTIKVDLWEDKAPLSVANFLQYAEDDHYDQTVFHRVVKGFVIQGGGFAAPFTGSGAPKATHGPIPQESLGTAHEEGTLAMARTNDPNSATSQWFINTARNTNLDSGYTVFGKVVEGMDVVRAIENAPVGNKGQFQGVPSEDVVITDVTVTTPDAAAKPALAAFRASYGVAPDRSVSVPVFLKNVGGKRLEAGLAATATGGATATVVRTPEALSAGQAGVGIVEVKAPAAWKGGIVTITASAGAASDSVVLDLTVLEASAAVAGDAHPKVSTFYLGLYDNGVVFDTTYGGLASRGFPMPGQFREHRDALKVWVGDGSAEGDYTPVIPGFAAGVIGLGTGETRTQRLTPEEGYKDGNFRTFEMTVKSLDG